MKARIAELKAKRTESQAGLSALAPVAPNRANDATLVKRLLALPDLSEVLRAADPRVLRDVFDAFRLQVEYDRLENHVKVTASVDEAVARAL